MNALNVWFGLPIIIWIVNGLLWLAAIYFFTRGTFFIFVKSKKLISSAMLNEQAAGLKILISGWDDVIKDEEKLSERKQKYIDKYHSMKGLLTDEEKANDIKELAEYKQSIQFDIDIRDGHSNALGGISALGASYTQNIAEIQATKMIAYGAAFFALSSFLAFISAILTTIFYNP
ncbi:hypothetical protein ACFLS8_00815 [Chloroflexota bacterium]